MKECKTKDELIDAIKNFTWYDEQGDAQISYDIALEAIQQALNIPHVVGQSEQLKCDCCGYKYSELTLKANGRKLCKDCV